VKRWQLVALTGKTLRPGWWTEDDGSASVACAGCGKMISAPRPQLRTAVVEHLVRDCLGVASPAARKSEPEQEVNP
jgi:hypothetical protein